MQTSRLHLWLLVLAAILSVAARTPAASLEVDVRPVFNGEPLLLDSLRYQNAAGESLSVTRLSFLLSGFALERADGSWLELTNQIAWMNAARRRSSILLKNIRPESYRSIRFHVGLDTNDNHADPARFAADHPLNPNLNDLHWNWQGGYIFLALEGLFRASATNELTGYSYHFARDPNRTRINLTAQLDLAHDALLLLDFDLAALLNAPRPLSFSRDGVSTHSRTNDPVAASLAANLPGAFRVHRVESALPAISRPTNVKPLYLPAKYTPYAFKMSSVFPIPDLPRDNPLIEERVALGEKLFHETALSQDGSISCASCHNSGNAFSDPRRYSVGVREQTGVRHAMPLFNLAWKSSFFWDGRAPSLRAQALMPIQDHTEMDESLTNVVAKLAALPAYPKLFAAAFGSPEITPEKIGLAVEQFLLTLTSYDSKFDRAFRGEGKLTAQEQRGFELFMTEYEPRTGHYGADCFHCHGGALFTDHQFHNNGLDAASAADPGRFKVTGHESDRLKFSTPSLRNVELTAPYMHDGRFKTLEEVVDHYSEHVQRSLTLDPNIAKHPDGGLHLSHDDKLALVAFLKTLTDEKYRLSQSLAVSTPRASAALPRR
jgi:cytochrome c peroxidase